MKDMPKIESPFVRAGKNWTVTHQIQEGYVWVFNDPEVLATEKIDGTNVSIMIEDGVIKSVWNRKNRIQLLTGDWRINEGLINANKKKMLPAEDGQHFGELVGPAVNGNPLKLDTHVWYPLSYLREHYTYKSFHNHPKTFENISKWFETDILSLFMRKRGITQFPEGIVFYQPSTGKMAKLRRDMFDWYKGKRQKECTACDERKDYQGGGTLWEAMALMHNEMKK